MPVLDDATATEDTFTNEGYYFMDKISANDTTEHRIEWSSSSASTITVDGKDVDVSKWGLSGFASVSIFATETDIVRVGVSNTGASITWIQIRGSTVAYAGASASFDATISAGTASIHLDSELSNRSLTYTDAYMIKADAGSYVMKKSNESAYMNADSEIYSLGYTTIDYGGGSDNTILKVAGDLDSVEISAVLQSTENEITFSDTVIHAETVSGHEDLYLFDKITFVATENNTNNDCTYSYVIVPYEVTAEKSVHFTDNQNAIFAAIPIMVIVALLIAVVALVFRGRDF